MKLFKILFIAIIVITCQSVNSQPVNVSLGNDSRTIKPDMFGYNGKTTMGPLWSDTTFRNAVQRAYPGNIRYPGGTVGNYFNWHTGTFIEGTGKTSNYPFPISEYIAGIPKNCSITFLVNLARPTPETGIPFDTTEEVLKSEEVLDLKIADILAAIDTFDANGVLPNRIEIGNEFYFDNEHGAIYASNPSLYVTHAAKLVRAIRVKYPSSTYPNMKIAIITTKGGSVKRDYWNQTIYDSLESNTQLAADIDAVTMHWYIGGEFGPQEVINDAEGAEIAIAQAFENVDAVTLKDYNRTPEWLEIWNTEYGTNNGNFAGTDTWASGVRSVAMTLNYFGMGSRMRCFNQQNIRAQIVNDQNKLAPNGFASALLSRVALNKTNANNLVFSNNPPFRKTYPSLIGWKFWNSDSEAVIIINCSRQSFDTVELSSVINNVDDKLSIQRYSNTPWVSGVSEESGVDETTKEDNSTTISIRPFSVTAIMTKTSQTSIGKYLSKVKSNNLINNFTFKSRNKHEYLISYNLNKNTNIEVKVFNIQGELVKKFKKESKNRGHHSMIWNAKNQPMGIYTVYIKAGNFDITNKVYLIK